MPSRLDFGVLNEGLHKDHPMDTPQFNIFDLVVAAVLVSSGVFAFRRGLVKEVMALGTWVLASVFAFSFYPLARPFFNEHIKNPMLADASTAIALFCLAIVTLVPLGDYLTSLVKSPTLSSIDRSLGFVFGVLRGFVIMCLLYLGTTFVWPEGQGYQPKWLEEARTKPALAYGVEALKGMVPEDPEEAMQREMKESRDMAEEAVESARRLEDISTPIPTYQRSKDAKPYSYDPENRNKMNDYIDRNTAQ